MNDTVLQERLTKLRLEAELLSTDIQSAYPNADSIFDAIDLASEYLKEAEQQFAVFDPDEDYGEDNDGEDDDSVEDETG